MAGPGDEIAAGTGGHLRASHADREQMIEVLKAAFVQGRLDKDEFDLRVSRVLASRTYADLAALTADLPAGPAEAVPPRHVAPAQARRPMSNAARAALWMVIAVAVPVVVSVPIGSAKLFLLLTPFYFMALAFLAAEMLAARLNKHSHRGQLPPGPAPRRDGAASPQPPSAGPGRQLPPGQRGHRPHAEAARRRPPRPPMPVHGRVDGCLARGTAPASG
jgi:hypothetical protein